MSTHERAIQLLVESPHCKVDSFVLAGQGLVRQLHLLGKAIPKVDQSFRNPVVGDGGEHVGEAFGYPLLETKELIFAEYIEGNGGHASFLDFAGDDEAGDHKILKGYDINVTSLGEEEVNQVAGEGVGLSQEVLLAAFRQ